MAKKSATKNRKFYSYILTHKEADKGESSWRDLCDPLRYGWWDDLTDMPRLRKAAYDIAIKRGLSLDAIHHTYARGLFSLDDNKNHVRFFIRQEDGPVFVMCEARLGDRECRTGTEKCYLMANTGEVYEEIA